MRSIAETYQVGLGHVSVLCRLIKTLFITLTQFKPKKFN